MTTARGTSRSWRVAVAVGVLVMGLGPVRVGAWGAQGHHVVARIAWAEMTPAARAQATALLGGGFDAFVAASTWADEIRASRPDTYNWHFVDIPLTQAHYDAARDCPASPKGDCVIVEIARARADLTRADRPAETRAEALKYLIHFVGDIHQPLHAIDNHDRGANDVRVAALREADGRPTNLHAAWDTGLINLSDETEAARAIRLLDQLRAHPASPALDPIAWAEESHDVAVRVTYHYPGFPTSGPTADYVTLDSAYRKAAADAIDRQLAVAGARLAALLNSELKSR